MESNQLYLWLKRLDNFTVSKKANGNDGSNNGNNESGAYSRENTKMFLTFCNVLRRFQSKRIFAKQNFVLQLRLIRQNNNYHKRKNVNGVKMIRLKYQLIKRAN